MGECEIVTLKASRLNLELYVKRSPWSGSCHILTWGLRRTSRDGSGTGHGHVAQVELLKKNGQFPDEPVK